MQKTWIYEEYISKRWICAAIIAVHYLMYGTAFINIFEDKIRMAFWVMFWLSLTLMMSFHRNILAGKPIKLYRSLPIEKNELIKMYFIAKIVVVSALFLLLLFLYMIMAFRAKEVPDFKIIPFLFCWIVILQSIYYPMEFLPGKSGQVILAMVWIFVCMFPGIITNLVDKTVLRSIVSQITEVIFSSGLTMSFTLFAITAVTCFVSLEIASRLYEKIAYME